MSRQFDKIEVDAEYRSTARTSPEFTLRRHRSFGGVYDAPEVGLGTLDDLRALDEKIAYVLRPTAEQVYESTLDNLFDGESEGDVEAPTGWFALVNWPNGCTYVVTHDHLGFSHMRASDDPQRNTISTAPTKAQLTKVYQGLCDEFSAWADLPEEEV
jgi:hypothetical protein